MHQRYFSPQALSSRAPHGTFTTNKRRFSGLVLEYFTQQAFLLEPHISVFKVLTGIARCSGCLGSFRHLHVLFISGSCFDYNTLSAIHPGVDLRYNAGLLAVEDKQETPYSCVPACLRMVLSSFGLELQEAELRTLCDCTTYSVVRQAVPRMSSGSI